MMIFWSLVIGLPLLAYGGALFFCSEGVKRFSHWFENSRAVAAALTIPAWFWTAYECHIIGIDVFDRFTKIFPGQLWIMAAVLSWLVIIWMPKNLSVRALCGILMLMPKTLFDTTHLYRPCAGTVFAPVDVFVYVAYVLLIVGMYGMFYPWRAEKFLDMILAKVWSQRLFASILVVVGTSLIVIGSTL